MKRFFLLMTAVLLAFGLTACSSASLDENEKQTSAVSNTSQSEQNKVTDESTQKEVGDEQMIYIKTGTHVLEVELCDNSSAAALVELLKEKDITIQMSDYGDFEKVGELGTSLVRNDQQITTQAGDLILYQGNKFVIYYDTNSWSFTRLGRIKNMSPRELKAVLGDGDVTVTLSMKK